MSFLRQCRPFALRAGLLFLCLAASFSLAAQEALKSTEEEYYDFLSIQGKAKRGFLSYRTLSDSVWTLETDAETDESITHAWVGNNLGSRFTLWQAKNPAGNWFAQGLDQSVTLKIYGPELFNSFNTAAPYGQNDGGLWQGKGYNMSFTAGARLEAYGFEITLKPQVSFSQNMDFALLPSAYDSDYGYFWGSNTSIDSPQRFGGSSFWNFDWGDTEVRWSWHSFTVGFGTQPIWLGPAYMSPILHSNNAGGYPKLDIGLRRQRVVIPKVGWYLGDIEARLWTGMLTESDYFDSDDTNDRNMIHGMTFSYAPSFIPGLVLTANRVCLVKWDWANLRYIIPIDDNTDEDQKMSFSFSWMFPKVGLEIYGELGKDDYSKYKVANPMHTLVWTAGLKKAFAFSEKHNVFGEFILELSNMEMSQDFQYQWAYSFYFHYQITQGYTNRGQILGNAWSPGGNSQFAGFNVYYPRGNTFIFVQRTNPDNNFIHKQTIKNSTESDRTTPAKWSSYRTYLAFGASTSYFVTKSLRAFGGVQVIRVDFPYYYYTQVDPDVYEDYSWMFHFELGAKWNF